MLNVINFLGVYYSYDKNFENQENFINLVPKNWKTFKAFENAKHIYCR